MEKEKAMKLQTQAITSQIQALTSQVQALTPQTHAMTSHENKKKPKIGQRGLALLTDAIQNTFPHFGLMMQMAREVS